MPTLDLRLLVTLPSSPAAIAEGARIPVSLQGGVAIPASSMTWKSVSASLKSSPEAATSIPAFLLTSMAIDIPWVSRGHVIRDTVGSTNLTASIRDNTATAATATTLALDGGASSTDDFYNGLVLQITGGTAGVGQRRTITDYDATGGAAEKLATVSPAWTTTPTGTITFSIYGAFTVIPLSSSHRLRWPMNPDACYQEFLAEEDINIPNGIIPANFDVTLWFDGASWLPRSRIPGSTTTTGCYSTLAENAKLELMLVFEYTVSENNF